MGNLRLLPMVAVATTCLLLLKVVSLYVMGGNIFSGQKAAVASVSGNEAEASDKKMRMAAKTSDTLVTGAAGEKKVAQKKEDDTQIRSGPDFKAAKSEFAILQSLANRRRKLDEREKQLILQRNLLKAAERRLESKIAQMKAMEARVSGDAKKKKSSSAERYRKLVEMYSKMKPVDAAKIFNRLNVEVLMGLVEHMNSRSMASILSAMDPAKAERLTIEIANQGKSDPMQTKSLPKINNK